MGDAVRAQSFDLSVPKQIKALDKKRRKFARNNKTQMTTDHQIDPEEVYRSRLVEDIGVLGRALDPMSWPEQPRGMYRVAIKAKETALVVVYNAWQHRDQLTPKQKAALNRLAPVL